MIAAQANALDRRVYGVVIGLVKDVNDPDGLQRVKLSFPWFYPGYEQWARVAHLYAAPNKAGSTWIPEPDSEVLVAFAHGDLRWPYVIGCLYSPVDRPPYVRDSRTDIRTLKTPKGLELAFDEAKGTVTLTTPKGASITLEETAAQVTIKATSKLVLEAATVEIKGTTEVIVRGGSIALNP